MIDVEIFGIRHEIHAPPGIWRTWAEPLAAKSAEIRRWIAARGIQRVLFRVAGTSAFIGLTRLKALADAAEGVLPQIDKAPARRDRAGFLGSGALRGAAREPTAGQTMTDRDSTPGFRHGPKAPVAGDTRVTVFIHPDAPTARYDRNITRRFPEASVTTVGAAGCGIAFAATGTARWDAVLYMLAARVRSARRGLNIDTPFCGQGNLTRVVTGVTIYPLNARGT
ncbi:hypothetical protein D2T29_21585 [Sinirhodobacter populi]|uniref:Uncharacterized protein n=1 Tax=Paenirhodobacter populi TaxID=2306993 RepID=A0A443JZD0_9RHOB|nr:hypothetical protein [Sinirhodobacter populi]RWR25882.1 hypothetical protein D2T29_21585 [Sinirhodobacter populi]